METTTVTAPDISCAHCKTAIEREIGDLAGVQSVSVDVPNKRVTVAHEPQRVSKADIVSRLDDEGYPVAD
jgi:copper chaperone